MADDAPKPATEAPAAVEAPKPSVKGFKLKGFKKASIAVPVAEVTSTATFAPPPGGEAPAAPLPRRGLFTRKNVPAAPPGAPPAPAPKPRTNTRKAAPAPAPAPKPVAPAPKPAAPAPTPKPAVSAPEPSAAPGGFDLFQGMAVKPPESPSVVSSSNEEEEEEAVSEDEDDGLLPNLKKLKSLIEAEETKIPYETSEEETAPFLPADHKNFLKFINVRYKNFTLPPLTGSFNPNACFDMKVETYKYQAFIREYMRSMSPYRGVLVYHGLGSGKTCTSIAAAEALYSEKQIIVMTPASLKQNYLSELQKCGFKHHNLQNHWVPLPLRREAQLFARTVLGISGSRIDALLKLEETKPGSAVAWVPDFTKEPNFDDLKPEEQQAIRDQIQNVLQNKIIFISYNGWSTKKLLAQYATDREFFNDKVIIIDEVHNLTRSMYKILDLYLKRPAKGKPRGKLSETVTTEEWDPRELKYRRPYVFYRLLSQAKRSKIIALSGTPIVNSPVELGILANILHGYFHCAEAKFKTTPEKDAILKTICDTHPYVQFYTIESSASGSTLFFTRIDEGYQKLFSDSGEFQGLYPSKDSPDSIFEIYTDIQAQAAAKGLKLPDYSPDSADVVFYARPLLPPTKDEFIEHFVDTTKTPVQLKNPFTFMKRMSGLISYYRGSKAELMPKVTVDEVVPCPMTPAQYASYGPARLKEMEEEDNQKKKKPKMDENGALVDDESVAGYRLFSRAICNFGFPKAIERPTPGKEQILKEADTTEPTLGDPGDTGNGVQQQEDEENAASTANEDSLAGEEEEEGATSGAAAGAEEGNENIIVSESNEDAAGGKGPKQVLRKYPEALAYALERLEDQKGDFFGIPADEDEIKEAGDTALAAYSPKFDKIIRKVYESAGPVLVYSTFKRVEGLGIFSMALRNEAFAEVLLTGPDTDLDLSESTKQSFRNEEQDGKRYILYTGDVNAIKRAALLNIFNMNFEKMPQKIKEFFETDDGTERFREQKVLNEERGHVVYANTLHGEPVKVIMITGAGAEGLSLFNVRQVHIIESHWNKVRTEQVKGRAVRICSHKNLPYSPDDSENERTVEIYTYVSTFKGSGLAIDSTLTIKDGGITSDEFIKQISDAKDLLAKSFITAIQKVAVDCGLNQTENFGEGEAPIKCFGVSSARDEFLYDPRLEIDLQKEKDFTVKPAATGAATTAAAATAATAAPITIQELKRGANPSYWIRKNAEGRNIVYQKKENAIAAANPYKLLVKDPATGKPSLKPLPE